MKKFKVTVNGTAYEVEVEEMGGSGTVPAAVKMPERTKSAAPAPKPAPQTKTPDSAKTDGSGTVLQAPMPGTVLDVMVKEGDVVSKGQVLLILEAMKMENEIMAIDRGTVLSISVSKGASVSVGDPMIILDFN